MSRELLTMDAANIFVGDDDPTNSQFLRIKNVKIPSLEEATMEHSGGGAMATVELGTRQIQALVLGFGLHGFNDDVLPSFMSGGSGRIKYTVRGNIRSASTHNDMELRAIVEGRMTKVDMGDFEKGKSMDSEYEIKEIMFYHLFFGGDEKFFFDYFAGPAGVRSDGVPLFQRVAANLGLT